MQNNWNFSRWAGSPVFWWGYYLLVMIKDLNWGWWIIFWLLGGLLASWFGYADQLVTVYLLRPTNQLSLEVKRVVDQKQWWRLMSMLKKRQDEAEMVMGLSMVFLVIWVILAVFVITSSNSWLARGLVMGIGLRGVSEIMAHWHRLPVLKQKMFWQIKRMISDEEVRMVVGIYLGVFVALTLLL